MTLKPEGIYPIPDETSQIARAAFPHSSLAMLLRDELGVLYTGQGFADFFPDEANQQKHHDDERWSRVLRKFQFSRHMRQSSS